MTNARCAAALLLIALCGPVQAGPACEKTRFEQSRFTVCAFDSRSMDLELVLTDGAGKPLRSLAALAARKDAARLRFATNAGMFDDSGRPVGLYIEGGRQLHGVDTADGPGNFHLKPNGVFSADADGTLHVETTEQFLAAGRTPLWATQSGPMLVIDGELHPKFAAEGTSRHLRNGVGLRDADTAFFVISDEPVSFGRFARFFRDGLGCREALYFDGAVSSLWWPGGGRKDGNAFLGPLLAVFDRTGARR